jgi:chemotaxis methyl-accepting protein methylase
MTCPKAPNHSYFWRHPAQMEAIAGHLSGFRDRGELKVWSAGCARGEEPYSISFLLNKLGLPYKILATDNNAESVRAARQAVYRRESFRLLPRVYEIVPVSEDTFTVPLQIKDAVEFQVADLLEEIDQVERFDLVLCRNVLIYFDKELQGKLIGQMTETLDTHGLLVLGYAESSLLEVPELRRLDDHGVFARRPVPVMKTSTISSPKIDTSEQEPSLSEALRDFAHGNFLSTREKLDELLLLKPDFLAGHYFVSLLDMEEDFPARARKRASFILTSRSRLDQDTSDYLKERGVTREQFFRSVSLVRERIDAAR